MFLMYIVLVVLVYYDIFNSDKGTIVIIKCCKYFDKKRNNNCRYKIKHVVL